MTTGQGGAEITEGYAPTLNCNSEAPIAFSEGYFRCGGGHSPRGDGKVSSQLTTGGGKPGQGAPCVAVHGTQDPCTSEDTAFALGRNSGQENALYWHMAVRRLTPVECERLQGFPGNWTKIKWRNKPAEQCPDGPRYKALGNSFAVNVVQWIGERIQYIENLTQ